MYKYTYQDSLARSNFFEPIRYVVIWIIYEIIYIYSVYILYTYICTYILTFISYPTALNIKNKSNKAQFTKNLTSRKTYNFNIIFSTIGQWSSQLLPIHNSDY